MKETSIFNDISTQCDATKDDQFDWITYYDLAKADEPIIQETLSQVKQFHTNVVPLLQHVSQHCKVVMQETGDRPTNFRPDSNYDLIRFQYKGTGIEFLKSKKETNRTFFFVAGCAYIHRLTDDCMVTLQHYGDSIGNINCITCNARCSPDSSYLDTLEDVSHCYEWLRNQGYLPENTVFMGNSSGGGTALAACMYFRDHGIPLPQGLIIQSAFINFKRDTPSYVKNKESDIIAGSTGLYDLIVETHANGQDLSNPYFSPYHGDYSNLPPILVQVSSEEIDYDDNYAIAEQSNLAGTPATLEVYHQVFHNFANVSRDLATSRFARNQVKLFIDQLI